MLVLPRESPAVHPHHQWPEEVQPGDKTSDEGGESFPQQGSLSALVTALAVEQSEEWLTGWRYLDMDMERLSEHRSKKREGKEVALIER